MSIDGDVRRAAEVIRSANALLISAGAGMGVDSGLPDFRGTHGFWRAYPVLAGLGISFEEIANPRSFKDDPTLAWAFYGHRLNLYRSIAPHPGFRQLLRIGASKPRGYFVFTSNVDGHFQKAGCSPQRIVECHGSIHHFQCTSCCTDQIWEADVQAIAIEGSSFRARNPLPKCKNCKRLARPNILMFGDGLWLNRRTDEQHERFSKWLDELRAASARVVVIELGAGNSIPTVRHTSEQVAGQLHGKLIRINPREAEVPDGHIGLTLGALEGITRICGF